MPAKISNMNTILAGKIIPGLSISKILEGIMVTFLSDAFPSDEIPL